MDQTPGYDLKPDDEVAILPTLGAPPGGVLEVAKIAHAEPLYVQLQDGRMFAIHSGMGLNTTGCIARVSHEHRKILKMLALATD
jgi:hypothetical protein